MANIASNLARSVFGVALLLALPANANAYVNDRFGFSVGVPSDWRAQAEPANDDGRAFDSPDGAARILVYGGFQATGSSGQAIEEKAQPRDGEKITYTKRGPRSVTVSGLTGSSIFYRRSILTCGGKVWNNFEITYPASQRSAYDTLVARFAASLRGGNPAGMKCR
jgi:hypothetical protein